MHEPDDPVWGNNVARMSDHRPRTDLVLRPARLPGPATIPPRQWLYGTHILRGFVSVLVAPGGTGKSALAMVVGVSLASGRSLLGEKVWERVNVAFLNLEDPMDELDRRLAAITIRHQIRDEEIRGRFFQHSGEDRPLHMAEAGEDGFEVIHPDEAALVEQINANQIGMICVDPFAESHSLEENSNPHMVAAAAAWRRVARATNCAILLVHHVRKPGKNGAAEGIDAARGAKALTDSARVGLLLSPMSEQEGEQIGIPPEERWQYVRLDNAKTNMAPRANRARWFKLDEVSLGNSSPIYPHGDRVAAVASWEPPNALAMQPDAELNRVLDLIDQGPAPGQLYSLSKQGGSKRWAGYVLMTALGFNEAQAKNTMDAWAKTGLLIEEEYRDSKSRRSMFGVRVDNTKRPGS